ncbi:Ig-like domain-containing protein [Oscillibacter sp. MSJ-2]|uniref:Ig-like domain-containing protein n=1 Tax=Dysosmobacter acutus TaxID=2841504 RepID=A0ABS6F8N2_9FIRM|nr:Ig-like domain-containing protein [Dysosmobacter acutus]MBU5626405.1 Ig-like domain-containing protein [Dysosmobacter acutus]
MLLTFTCTVNADATGDQTVTLQIDTWYEQDDDLTDIQYTITPAIVTVTAAPTPATGISLNKDELTLTAGATETLTATVTPSDTTDTVAWSSNKPEVATVDSTGKVTAVAPGEATITAKAGEQSASCAVTVNEATPTPVPVASIELNKTALTLEVGKNETLTATVKPDNAEDKTVTWTSSDETVATVENGKVTAVKAGTATITAKAGEQSASCAVTVNEATPTPVPVASIELNKTALTLEVGKNETLTATVKPDNAEDKTVTWTSSDETVATVENGKVTAVKAGTATITAKAGEQSASCAVTVNEATPTPVPVASIELNKTALTLEVGKNETLTATVKPDNAEDKTVTWTSSDETVATVENGKVTAVKAGTATITAKAGEQSASCAVTVNEATPTPVPVASIELNKTALTLEVGKNETLTATVKPDNAEDKTVTWTSSDETVATVENGKVTAVKAGTATITAKAGEQSASCAVTVNEATPTPVPVASIELNKTALTLEVGKNETLTATVKPDNAEDKTVTWTSSDETVATVENGKVTAVKAGTATITAKAGEQSASCAVTVKNSDSGSSGGGGGGSSVTTYAITVKDAKNGDVSANRKSASKGTTITLTVAPDKGYVLDDITVLDSKDKEIKLTEKGGKFTFTMPASKVTVQATFKAEAPVIDHPFTDVPEGSYYEDAVIWAVDKGITTGTSATTFTPDGICTRAQAVTFLWRAAGSPAPKSSAMPFTDVKAGSYYYDAVLWAVEQGITKGTSDTAFSPNASCTRAQIVTFLWRANGSPAVSGNSAFTDVAADAYYAAAVTWAEKNGVTGGIGNGLFGSGNNCTRAQIVTFLYRAMK